MKHEFNWGNPYYQVLNISKNQTNAANEQEIELITKYNMYEIELYDKYKEKHKQEFNRFLNKYERDLFKLKLKEEALLIA